MRHRATADAADFAMAFVKPVHALHACVSGPLCGAQVLFCPAMTRQGDHGYDRDSRYLLGFVAGEESIRTLGDCDARWLAAEYAGVVRFHRRQDPCELSTRPAQRAKYKAGRQSGSVNFGPTQS